MGLRCEELKEEVRGKELDLLENVENLLVALYYQDDKEQIIAIVKQKLQTLKNILHDDFKIRKLDLLENNIRTYEKGLVSFSDYFFEQCMYILMCIKKGACCV